jgi:hypothetical protein
MMTNFTIGVGNSCKLLRLPGTPENTDIDYCEPLRRIHGREWVRECEPKRADAKSRNDGAALNG